MLGLKLNHVSKSGLDSLLPVDRQPLCKRVYSNQTCELSIYVTYTFISKSLLTILQLLLEYSMKLALDTQWGAHSIMVIIKYSVNHDLLTTTYVFPWRQPNKEWILNSLRCNFNVSICIKMKRLGSHCHENSVFIHILDEKTIQSRIF